MYSAKTTGYFFARRGTILYRRNQRKNKRLQKPEKRTVTLENLDIKVPDTKLETVVISDGQLLQNSLRLCKNSKETVDKILYKENVAIDDIFIMTLDGAGNYKIITKEN